MELTVVNTFELIYGFAEGTAIVSGPEFSLCIDYTKTYVEKIESISSSWAYQRSKKDDPDY